MVILLNINCCGGKGLEKWNRIKNYFVNPETTVLQTNENGLSARLEESLEKGEKQFIAAGGDGTINYLLNYLIHLTSPEQLKKITFGAIGIGSSNDFHKPTNSKIGEIPICIDFQNTYHRDVGVITYGSDKVEVKKHFLINASIGITAEANNLFNKSDLILKRLKKCNTKTAIFYSAIKTIMNYKNLSAELSVNESCIRTSITNLGITKNSHFAGGFCYDSQVDYANGKFAIHLAYDMNKFEVLNLMKALASNSFSKLRKTKSWRTDWVKIASRNNFAVEYDGEVITTREIEFKILKNFIRVCGNGKNF